MRSRLCSAVAAFLVSMTPITHFLVCWTMAGRVGHTVYPGWIRTVSPTLSQADHER